MTKKKAKKLGFTHYGKTYGFIKIFAKDIESFEPEITGTNVFWNILLEIFSEIDMALNLSDGFTMEVTELI